MLNANGLSFKDLKNVEYARYPQAGPVRAAARFVGGDHRAARRMGGLGQGAQRRRQGAGRVQRGARRLLGGGAQEAARRSMRGKLAHWFETDAPSCGLKPVYAHPDLAPYTRVAELGTFTPKALPGATVVDLDTVKSLVGNGAVLVDTRIEAEYKDKHIPGALWLPYGEKSLKDVAFDPQARQLPRPRQARPRTEDRVPVQRPGMLEVVQGQPAPRSPPATSTSTGSAAACPSGRWPASAPRSRARTWRCRTRTPHRRAGEGSTRPTIGIVAACPDM